MSDNRQARLTYRGPALFSGGFRPFFLGGAVFAFLGVWGWAYALSHGVAEIGGRPAPSWHIHEMLYGFFAAIAAGFLLTAIPNWTGRLPIRGKSLAALAALWLVGRIAMAVPDPLGWPAAIADAAFLIVFSSLIWREILAGRNWRNLPVATLVSLFAISNIAFHVMDPFSPGGLVAQRLALGVPALLVALIGGRIVPSFTRNWLAQRGGGPMPAPESRFDYLCLGLAALGLGLWSLWPTSQGAGIALCLAGLMHGVRLFRWKAWRTGAEPLVWILHVGYGWLVLAFLAMGIAVLAPDVITAATALHFLTAGAIGTMTLAMMTRATLGHTGQEHRANRMTTAIYVAVIAGTVLRVSAGTLPPTLYLGAINLSAFMWGGAFLLFAVHYGPLILRPRGDRA